MLTWRPAIVLALGVALVGALQAPQWALAPVVLAALLVAADFALAGSPADLRLARDGDRQVRLGDSATVRLTLTNSGLRVVRADVRDAWVPSAGASTKVHHVELDPGESTTLETTLLPTRRGDRAAVRVTVRSYGPMGFAYRQPAARAARAATPPWTLRVLPRFESRRFLADKLAKLRVFDGATVTVGRGQGTEFDTLREYVRGDDVRSIDWRGTARRSDVVVRTWRPERDRHVLIVIDSGRTSAMRVGAPRTASSTASALTAASTTAGSTASAPTESGEATRDEPRLDAAIDAALLLSEVAHRAGDSVAVFAVDTAVRAAVSGGGNRAVLPSLVSALATVEPSLVETDFELLVSEVLRRQRKRALVVLLTALEAGTLGEGLLPVLNQLTARHRLMVAAVHDPGLEEALAARGNADAVYLSAAAHRTATERQRVVAALTRHDVTVVDAPVSRYASQVVDAYLMLKALGRL